MMSKFAAFEAQAPAYRVTNYQVYQKGEKIAEHHWLGEHRVNTYSASKSFTATAVGIALKEGLLSLDERVVDCFAAEIAALYPAGADENLAALTVRDLLTMGVGQEQPLLMGEDRPFLKEEDWVGYALAQPISVKPGSRFLYSNTGPYLAGILVQRRAGCTLTDYLYPRLFAPLGIQRPTWECDPRGNTFGAGGLFLCVSELAKLGLLYLQKGRWGKKQIVSEQWVKQASAKQMDNGKQGYGYLFWLGKQGTFRADGKYGQFAIVSEQKQAVIAINAQCPDQDALLELVYDQILNNL